MADSPLKQRFVLDTSLFITEEIRGPDEDLEEALLALLDRIARARLEHNISCYMPPSIHDELTTMLRNREVSESVHSKLDTWIVRKSPSRFEIMVPAELVYRFVDEINDRVDQGLRVSEEAVRDAAGLEGEPVENHEYMTDIDRVISGLRDDYRRTLRQGILDSREDFDLVLLARELEAGVVTEDRGVIGWADDFGLRYLRGRAFPDLLDEYQEATDE